MITEIGLAALAVSPVIGLMISGEIRTKKDAYESAFREGEKCGSELAMLTARITIKSLQRKNKNLVDELDGVQSRLDDLQMELNELHKPYPTAEAYMACMNWGARQ